ncbi:MAG: type VI secretion system protein TssA [Acidobacteriota bacterium]
MSADFSSPSVIDLETLLAPISDDNPSGENQRYSGLYDEVREARRQDEELAQGDWKRDLKAADWDEVLRLSSEALAERTKDLQVAGWLGEAIIKQHGFVGLRDSLYLLRRLHEDFWETVFPEEDEGDLEARANAMSWYDRQAAVAIKEVAITNSFKGVYSYFQYEDSKKFDVPDNLEAQESDVIERANQAKVQAEAEGKITTEDWRNAKNGTNRAFYEETAKVLNECWQEFSQLDSVMDDKFGRQTPGLGELKKSLEAIRSFVDIIVKEKRILEPDPSDETASEESYEETEDGSVVGRGKMSSGTISSRQEALRKLNELAEFFRKTEPHSPVSYLVQRAVKWGNMPLEMWLKDVIKDGGTLDAILETLGLGGGSGGSYPTESPSSESESSDW